LVLVVKCEVSTTTITYSRYLLICSMKRRIHVLHTHLSTCIIEDKQMTARLASRRLMHATSFWEREDSFEEPAKKRKHKIHFKVNNKDAFRQW